MSTADFQLVFSPLYENIFKTNDISPRTFQSIGYLYNGVPHFFLHRVKALREKLRACGVTFIVCYLDESVQNDKWGLVSRKEHLYELHMLANKVLNDETFAVVIKSQFIYSSPSKLYPNDQLICQAKSSGRFVEMMHGTHRNNIYPSEAALVSDLVIGHKFGATASLEAAVFGVRSVLLNSYGVKTIWDDIISNEDIEYPNIDEALKAMDSFRLGDSISTNLGDWTAIIHYFDPYRDGGATNALFEFVLSLCDFKVHEKNVKNE
jgi:hypothetical protein